MMWLQMTDDREKESASLTPLAVTSGNGLPTAVVRGSFHRKAGIREFVDISNSFVIRTVEIKRETGKNIGFYITQGDGLSRADGVFVSRISLGSTVDVNSLLHVGEEIIKVNGVDITNLSLDNVVILMQNVAAKLILTVKIRTSATILRNFSRKKANPVLLQQRQLPSERHSLTQYSPMMQHLPTELEESDIDIDFEEASNDNDNLVPLNEIGHGNSLFDHGASSPNPQCKNQTHEANECLSDIQITSSTHIPTSQDETYSPVSSSPPTPPSSPPPNLSSSHMSSTSLSKSLSFSTSLVTHQLLEASSKLESENPLPLLSQSVSHCSPLLLKEPPSPSTLPAHMASTPSSLPPSTPNSKPPLLPTPITLSQSPPTTPTLPTQCSPCLQTISHTNLTPPTSKPPPPPSQDSDSDEEDMFSLKDIEEGLKHKLDDSEELIDYGSN